MKAMIPDGAIPAKASDNERAIATTRLALSCRGQRRKAAPRRQTVARSLKPEGDLGVERLGESWVSEDLATQVSAWRHEKGAN